MSDAATGATLAVTGALPLVILLVALAAPFLAYLLLKRYRRAVLRAMAKSAHVKPDTPPVTAARESASPQRSLSLSVIDAASIGTAGDTGVAWRVSTIYTVAACVFALVMTIATLASAHIEILPVRLALLFTVYVWPVFLILYLDGSTSRRTMFLCLCSYLGVIAILGAVALARSPDLTVMQLTFLWLIMNAPALLITSAFIARPVRAIGPLVVLFLVVTITGSVMVLAVAGSSDDVLRAVAAVAANLGLGAMVTLVAMTLAGATLFAPLGWLALAALRRAYLAKWINDKSIAIDAVLLLFGTVQSIGLAFEGLPWILAGPIAFLLYQVTLRLGLRLSFSTSRNNRAVKRLLLLRVFALGKRSQDLFGKVAARWRYRGPIQLIAGPDLATTTIDPEEFLEFVTGRLDQLFINDKAQLARRLAALDCEQDFDHRYRVNDFFCREDTWKSALTALVQDSSVVLMDLREFTPGNAGCVYELTELLNLVPLQKIVLVIDNSTDFAFLEQTLSNAWLELRSHSPNRAEARADIQVIRVDGYGEPQLLGLLAALQAAA